MHRRPMQKHRSRRVSELQDSDIDHQIVLLDRDSLDQSRAGEPHEDAIHPTSSNPPATIAGTSSPEPLLRSSRSSLTGQQPDGVNGRGSHGENGCSSPIQDDETVTTSGPIVAIQAPTPVAESEPPPPPQNGKAAAAARPLSQNGRKPHRDHGAETAIDVLYENQRGLFLCGKPLFSRKALGNLDPPPWTNAAHKPSPTDINTAQVPDPSWEWAWPEWRVNHADGTDQEGWEYSFMFARAFSWHKAHWWNSFVRRRAWVRQRVKRGLGYISQDPHMLNLEYFSIRPACEVTHSRSSSRAPSTVGRSGDGRSSHRGSKHSLAATGPQHQHEDGDEAQKPDVEDMETLLHTLRASRIDREKIEAVENYLKHAGDDLVHLQEEMHNIMSLFVFQASRRALLTRLTEVYDEAVKLEQQQNAASGSSSEAATGQSLGGKVKNLEAATKHADEEVRRLEYWSDVKGVVQEGESGSAVDQQHGWSSEWTGIDNSGPGAPSQRPTWQTARETMGDEPDEKARDT